MHRKKIIISLLILNNYASSMEEREKPEIRLLPTDIVHIITEDVIKLSKNLDDAIKNFKEAVINILKVQNIELTDSQKVSFINLISSRFKALPFDVAKKLDFELTPELKKNIVESHPILKRYGITLDELETWFDAHKKIPQAKFFAYIKTPEFGQREKLIAIATALFYNNINPNIKDVFGTTALTNAVLRQNKDIVELLLNSGANVNLQDSSQHTALMSAAGGNFQDIAQLLLDAKADPNIQDIDGRTALMAAVRNNHASMVKLLLIYEANPNLRDNKHQTALIFAVQNNSRTEVQKTPITPTSGFAITSKVIVGLLLNAHAKTDFKDIWGKTALQYAKDPQIIEWLKSRRTK